jgi:hypothetical protein
VNRNATILSVLTMIAVMLLATVAVAFAATGKGAGDKVSLCHKGTTITVGGAAAAAHERHGDTEGACPTDTDSPEPPGETTAEETSAEETTAPDTPADAQYGGGQEKVTLCHKGHAITVGAPALAAHERHGDDEGACPTDDGDGSADDASNGQQRGADLYGDSAADNLRGGPRRDFLQGGRGRDVMLGRTNNDYIDGADGIAGNDVLDGGQGIDRCVGDKGDTFRYCDGNVVRVPRPTATSAQTGAGN